MAGKPGESKEAQAEARGPTSSASAGYQGQGRGSGVTDARPSPGGGNTGGGSDRDKQNDSNRDKQRAADDARAKATQDAVDRDKRLSAITEGMRQSELQRVAAGIASLRGVPLPQVQEARVTPGQARFKRDVDLDAAYDAVQAGLTMQGSGAMSPPVSPVAPTINPLTATAGRYGTMGSRAPAITGVSAEDRERMIRTVLGEAGGEPVIGQTGVASVIANRLRAGNYGSTIGDVVNAPKQFSTWNPGDPAGDMANRIDPNSQAYKTAAEVVDSVLKGEARDPTGGALNFSNVDTVMTSGQASEATKARVAAESALPSATPIGRHTFTSPTGDRPTQVARSSFSEGLQKTFDTIGAGVKTVADATGVSSVADFLTNKSLRDEIVRDNNRDRQMTSEEVNIAMFNRLHPEAGSNKELYGGRDQTPLPTQVASTATPPPVVPPVVPTEPVMPTVPNFAAAQQYIGTPTVATPGFNFLMPFAPRPPIDFANLGQAYAPTALASAPPPQPLPGIPGAAYATPYQRLG